VSLDIWFKLDSPVQKEQGSGIFVRKNGATVEISEEEWYRNNPGREPVRVEADNSETCEVFSANCTHNLSRMAQEAGIRDAVWAPELNGIERAEHLIDPVKRGIETLEGDPERFKAFNPENGWGTYESLLEFLRSILDAALRWPEASVHVWR
jgi:hypothetical protein